jgi:hypothetical protein
MTLVPAAGTFGVVVGGFGAFAVATFARPTCLATGALPTWRPSSTS